MRNDPRFITLCAWASFLLVVGGVHGEDGRNERAARVKVDLAKVRFYGREIQNDSIDTSFLTIKGSEASGQVPMPTLKGRTSDLVTCIVPMPETAQSATLTYRVKLGDGAVHQVVIVLKNGLELLLADIEAAKMQGLRAELTISPDEWHTIAVSLSKDGSEVEVDGKLVRQSPQALKQPIRPLELRFVRDGAEPAVFAISDVAVESITD
jgi:hypothetical protein